MRIGLAGAAYAYTKTVCRLTSSVPNSSASMRLSFSSKQSSITSFIFFRASSRVFPCVKQPESAGHCTMYQPSSPRFTTTGKRLLPLCTLFFFIREILRRALRTCNVRYASRKDDRTNSPCLPHDAAHCSQKTSLGKRIIRPSGPTRRKRRRLYLF